MPRKKVFLSDNWPLHITARCINRQWFELPLHDVWTIMGNYLYFIHITYDVKIYSFVLMPNHFHLIVQCPKSNLSQAMNYFMRETSRQIGRETKRINQIYGGRFHRTSIQEARYFQHAYKYVYRNPVKAGIVVSPEDYPFSTLAGKIGKVSLRIPVEEDTLLFSPNFCSEALQWLRTPTRAEDDETVRLALTRQKFQLPQDRKTRTPNHLETERY